jgi:hypothetical protein
MEGNAKKRRTLTALYAYVRTITSAQQNVSAMQKKLRAY